MKINAINLKAYGPFTNKVLDFWDDGFGLHLVFGGNEAGKSTALRALIGLLYGFGHRVDDNWLHENKKLLVSGTFALKDGRLLNLSRYKRRKNDLIDEDTGLAFRQEELNKHLGQMGRDAFEHAFGISHESLRQGVGSVLAAGGDLGHALFAATSGMNSLKRVMTRLEEQQAGLFTPRGQLPEINAGISQIASLRKGQREASASHMQWKKMKKQLDIFRQRELDTGNKLESLSIQTMLLSRYHDALKYVPRREKLKKELDRIGPVPDLRSDFSEQRTATQVGLREAEQISDNLKIELENIEKRLETLVYEDRVISNKILIERLADESNVHAKALVDSRTLRARIHQHRETAREALNLLRPGKSLEEAEGLRLSKPEKTKIQRLGEKGIKLEEALRSVTEALQSSCTGREKLASQLEKLDAPMNIQELEDCLARSAEHGNLEDRITEAQTEEELLKTKVDTDLVALPLWEGDLFQLERVPVPTLETMRSMETDLTALDRKLEDIQKEYNKVSKQLVAKEKDLSGLRKTRKLPSMEELEFHRGLRDMGWQSVRKVWLEGREPDPQFMREFSRCSDLADAYERSVCKADEIADILYSEANSVSRAESIKKEIGELKESLNAIKAHQSELSVNRGKLWSQWLKFWEPVAIVPLSPREMIEWSCRVGELRQKAGDLKKAKNTSSRLQTLMDRIKNDITFALKCLNVNVPDKINFSSLMALASRTRDHAVQYREKRRVLRLRIEDLNADIDKHSRRKIQIEQDLRNWSSQWAQAVSKLGFEEGARPEEVHDFVLAIDDVFEQVEMEKELRRRIAAMEHDYKAYCARVADAVKNLAPEFGCLASETAALKLNSLLRQNIELRKEHHILENEKRKKNSELAKINQNLVSLWETMRLLCQEARSDNHEQLPEIEKLSKKRIQLCDELRNVDERLNELASGQDLESFIDKVKANDPDELAARLDRLKSEKKGLQEEQRELVAEIALAKKELDSIGGQSRALALAEKAEGFYGKIQADVDRYIELKLASAILSKAIERYRQSNQNPVLEAAGKYFETITRGSFTGLRADYDHKGEPVIKATRPDGKLLTVQELSDGSRDQLFLALRLGGLSKYVKHNGPMPFIIDDVLVHFDDDRSVAALDALGTFAGETQIIFFTHHPHLMKLAEGSSARNYLRIHFI